MTCRERLLEQVRALEELAAQDGETAARMTQEQSSYARRAASFYADAAAHHALTAMALREVIELADDIDADCKCGWKWDLP